MSPFDTQVHLCMECVYACVTKWVKRRSRERPGTKGPGLGPGLASCPGFWDGKQRKQEEPLTSLVELLVGQEHRTMTTDWD